MSGQSSPSSRLVFGSKVSASAQRCGVQFKDLPEQEFTIRHSTPAENRDLTLMLSSFRAAIGGATTNDTAEVDHDSASPTRHASPLRMDELHASERPDSVPINSTRTMDQQGSSGAIVPHVPEPDRRRGGRKKPAERASAVVWEAPIEREEGGVLLRGTCSHCLRLAMHGAVVEGKTVTEEHARELLEVHIEEAGKGMTMQQTIVKRKAKYEGDHFKTKKRDARHAEYMAHREQYDDEPDVNQLANGQPQPVPMPSETRMADDRMVEKFNLKSWAWWQLSHNFVAAAALWAIACGSDAPGACTDVQACAIDVIQRFRKAEDWVASRYYELSLVHRLRCFDAAAYGLKEAEADMYVLQHTLLALEQTPLRDLALRAVRMYVTQGMTSLRGYKVPHMAHRTMSRMRETFTEVMELYASVYAEAKRLMPDAVFDAVLDGAVSQYGYCRDTLQIVLGQLEKVGERSPIQTLIMEHAATFHRKAVEREAHRIAHKARSAAQQVAVDEDLPLAETYRCMQTKLLEAARDAAWTPLIADKLREEAAAHGEEAARIETEFGLTTPNRAALTAQTADGLASTAPPSETQTTAEPAGTAGAVATAMDESGADGGGGGGVPDKAPGVSSDSAAGSGAAAQSARKPPADQIAAEHAAATLPACAAPAACEPSPKRQKTVPDAHALVDVSALPGRRV